MKRKKKLLIYVMMLILLLGILRSSHLLKEQNQNSKIILLTECRELNLSGLYSLYSDINETMTCFNISSDNIIINGNGHRIVGTQDADIQAFYIENVRNVTIKNFNIINYKEGIFANNVKNLNIINNSFIFNLQGILLYNITNADLINNYLDSSGNFGVILLSSSDIFLSKNILSENIYSLYSGENKETLFSSNLFTKNLHPLIHVSRDSPIIQKGVVSKFNFSLPYKDDCTSCSYKVELFPYENNLIAYKEGGIVYGSFVPTRRGIYSLRTEIKDAGNNTFIKKSLYLISPSDEAIAYYYLRGINPVHSQLESYGLYHKDSGSLLFEKPDKEEYRICSDLVHFSPDELPEYLLGVVKDINFSLKYSHNSTDAAVGVQRVTTFGEALDYEIPINQTNGQVVSGKFDFNVDWHMNYFWSWYFIAIKLIAEGGYPKIFIDPTDPSYAVIKYVYSSTPAIKKISNRNIMFLSATMEDNSDKAEIILEGEGLTQLVIQMPDKNKIYSGAYNNMPCDNLYCSLISQSNGELDFILNVNKRGNLVIVPVD